MGFAPLRSQINPGYPETVRPKVPTVRVPRGLISNAVGRRRRMTRPIDTTKFPDLSAGALGFDPDALALAMWRYSNPYADPDPDVALGRRQQSKASAQVRKPSIRTVVKQAEKATGKTVTSITTPDGTTLHFGEPEPTEAT